MHSERNLHITKFHAMHGHQPQRLSKLKHTVPCLKNLYQIVQSPCIAVHTQNTYPVCIGPISEIESINGTPQ